MEVADRPVAPAPCVIRLEVQPLADGFETLGIDLTFQALPRRSHLLGPAAPVVVAVAEFVPHAAAGRDLVSPRDVMKPKQVLLGAGADVAEAFAQRRGVLRDGVAAGCSAIEANA